MRTLRLFWLDLKKSKLYTFLTICLAIASTLLLAWAAGELANAIKPLSIKTAKEGEFVKFASYTRKGIDMAEAAKFGNIEGLATAYSPDGGKTVIASPAVRNMTGLGIELEAPSDGYACAYVARSLSKKYEIGKTYRIVKNGYSREIKVKGYLKNAECWTFKMFFSDILGVAEIYICDELPDDSVVGSGIYFEGFDEAETKAAGFKGQSMSECREGVWEDVRTAATIAYLPFCLFLLAAAVTVTFYYIRSDKNARRNAALFVCGMSRGEAVKCEILNFLSVYIVPLIVALAVCLSDDSEKNRLMGNTPTFFAGYTMASAAAVCLGLALCSAVFLFKRVKASPFYE